MWSYYGAKTNIAHYYPLPDHGRIIEPFAGSARYSLEHWRNQVTLIDRYPVIVKIWHFIQRSDDRQLRALIRPVYAGQSIKDHKFDSEGAQLLFSFLIGKGAERPRQTVAGRVAIDRPNHINYSIERIIANRYKILHWDIVCDDYRNVENKRVTWFIDPPYVRGGESYVFGAARINFVDLGRWCASRKGRVIVCEKVGATWLPFVPLVQQKGSAGMQDEAFFYLPESSGAGFAPSQLSLF